MSSSLFNCGWKYFYGTDTLTYAVEDVAEWGMIFYYAEEGAPLCLDCGVEEGYEIEIGTVNWIYLPKGTRLQIKNEGSPKGMPTFLYLSINAMWLNTLLHMMERKTKSLIEEGGQAGLVSFCPMSITPFMKNCIRDVQLLRKEEFYDSLLAQTYITQLIIKTTPLFKPKLCDASCRIKTLHYKKIIAAEKLIRENMQEPCSLIALAKKVGTNECTLKRGFKEMYGTTMFNYLINLRMQKALALLQEDKTVGEVAFRIGYKNHSNFTAAFKRKYGYTPKKVLRVQEES